MTPEDHKALSDIAQDRFRASIRLAEWLETHKPTKEEDTRTDAQHRALFTWFGMIEKAAAEQGVTFDLIIKHTHQLKVTKEGLHALVKTLQKALWDTDSTKKLEKKQVDVVIDHLTDLLSKEMEVPPFPTAAFSPHSYPDEYNGPPTF